MQKAITSDLIGLLESKAATLVILGAATEELEEPEEPEMPVSKKITPDKIDPVYNFTFDFRGSNGINLSNFSLCNLSIQPQIANNNSATSVVTAITNGVV